MKKIDEIVSALKGFFGSADAKEESTMVVENVTSNLYVEPSPSERIDAYINDSEQQNKPDTVDSELITSQGKDTFHKQEMVELLGQLIEEMDALSQKTDNIESKEIFIFCQERLLEILKIDNVTLIDDDNLYDPVRHVPVPLTYIQSGATIEYTLRPGVEYNGHVIIKAKVKIKEQ